MEEEAKEPKRKTKSEAAPTQLIYCGPNLTGGILNQFAGYRNGLPGHLTNHFEKCPAIRDLFVSPVDLAGTLKAIQEPGTPEHICFAEITEYNKGGAKQ